MHGQGEGVEGFYFPGLADDRAIIGQKLHFIPESGGNVQWIGSTVGFNEEIAVHHINCHENQYLAKNFSNVSPFMLVNLQASR